MHFYQSTKRKKRKKQKKARKKLQMHYQKDLIVQVRHIAREEGGPKEKYLLSYQLWGWPV